MMIRIECLWIFTLCCSSSDQIKSKIDFEFISKIWKDIFQCFLESYLKNRGRDVSKHLALDESYIKLQSHDFRIHKFG